MKNIGIVTPHLSGNGGTETVISKVLASPEIRKSFKLSLIIDGGSDDEEWLDDIDSAVKISLFRSHFNPLKLLYLIGYFIFSKKDIFLIVDTRLIAISYVVKRIFKKKYKIVSWIHFSLFDSTSVRTQYLKYADHHLAISSGIADQLRNLGIVSDKISIIYNPISPQPDEVKRRTTITDKMRFIYIGRIQFRHQKNLKLILDALALYDKPWQIDIYGDGEDFVECKIYAEKLAIQNNINWHGWKNDPWAEVVNCDALLLSSNYEGLPMILLESLAYGVPVISRDCPTGPKDIVSNKLNGILIEGNTPALFLKGIHDFEKYLPNINSVQIKQSISKFYNDSYYHNLMMKLNKI